MSDAHAHADPGRDPPYHRGFERRGLFPASISAQVEIDAPRALVWEILSDVASYRDWNPFTPQAKTDLRVGSPVDLEVAMRPGRVLERREWVNRVEAGRRICWGMHLLHPALLTANRWQELEDLDGGGTRYRTEDRLSGLLTPLVMALYGGVMARGFQAMANALGATAEARALGTTDGQERS